MSYITYTELIDRYPIIATWNDSELIINNDLIYYAEKQVEGMLSSCFTVPFTAAHPTVKDLCLDMSYYKAMVTKDPKKAASVKSAIIDRIADIKKGDEYIMTSSGTLGMEKIDGNNEIWSSVKGYYPVHSMLGAEDEDTQIDPDLLDDLGDERA